jgi:hypothetical protein
MAKEKKINWCVYSIYHTDTWSDATRDFLCHCFVCLNVIGLAYLCEFIKDNEHTSLATRILHLLGREGPRTTTPVKYIRYAGCPINK